LQTGDPMMLLEQRGVPAVWRRSVAEALAVIDFLDARIDAELLPIARDDRRVQLLEFDRALDHALGEIREQTRA